MEVHSQKSYINYGYSVGCCKFCLWYNHELFLIERRSGLCKYMFIENLSDYMRSLTCNCSHEDIYIIRTQNLEYKYHYVLIFF